MSLKQLDAEEQYALDVNLKREDVQAIFQWLKKQPHLPEMTESQVVLFLRSCDHSIEAAKTLIDKYFTLRTHCPDLFECIDGDVVREALATEFCGVLPRKTPEGYVIIMCKLLDHRPEKYVCINHLKVGVMTLTLYLHIHGSVDGVIFLFDTEGATFGHLARMNFAAIRNLLYFIQEAAPIRVKGIHYVNVVPVTEKGVVLIKPFLKKEVYSLLNLHSNFDTLYKCIPRDCLPVDYGGDLASIEVLRDESMDRLLGNLDFFEWHSSQRVDETKRTGKSLDLDTVFGIDGSFKKLEID